MDSNFKKYMCENFSQYLPEWVCKQSEQEGCFGKVTIKHQPKDLAKQTNNPEEALEERCQSSKPTIVNWNPNSSTPEMPFPK